MQIHHNFENFCTGHVGCRTCVAQPSRKHVLVGPGHILMNDWSSRHFANGGASSMSKFKPPTYTQPTVQPDELRPTRMMSHNSTRAMCCLHIILRVSCVYQTRSVYLLARGGAQVKRAWRHIRSLFHARSMHVC